MTEQESNRIATLTTGAIKTTMESAVKAMMAAVEAAEDKTKELRDATEEFIKDFELVTSNLSDNVNAHVMACQTAIDTFQAHHLKILNVDSKEPPEPRIEPKATLSPRAEEEIGKIQALAVSRIDGKR